MFLQPKKSLKLLIENNNPHIPATLRFLITLVPVILLFLDLLKALSLDFHWSYLRFLLSFPDNIYTALLSSLSAPCAWSSVSFPSKCWIFWANWLNFFLVFSFPHFPPLTPRSLLSLLNLVMTTFPAILKRG